MKIYTLGKMGGGCIRGGTLVLTSEGYRNIEELYGKNKLKERKSYFASYKRIPPALRVLSFDGSNVWWSNPSLIWKIPYKGYLLEIEIEESTLPLTPWHPIFVSKDPSIEIPAALIKRGMGVLTVERGKIDVKRVDDIKWAYFSGYLYDLTVPGGHTYVSTPLNIITHNTGSTTISLNTTIWLSKLRPSPSRKYVYIGSDFGRQSAAYLWDPEFFRLRREDPDSYPTLKEYLEGTAEAWEIAHVSNRFEFYKSIAFIPASPITTDEKDLTDKYDNYLSKMDDLVSFLRTRASIVIIDGPGSGGLGGLRDYLVLIPAADAFIPVVEPNKPSVDAVQPLINMALLMNVDYPLFVVNKVRDEDFKNIANLVKPLYAPPLNQKPIYVRFDDDVERAYKEGIPIVALNPNSKTSRDIRLIAESMLNIKNGNQILPSQKINSLRGLLGKLRRFKPEMKIKIPFMKPKELPPEDVEEEFKSIEKILKELAEQSEIK